jgi:hypothetical protein
LNAKDFGFDKPVTGSTCVSETLKQLSSQRSATWNGNFELVVVAVCVVDVVVVLVVVLVALDPVTMSFACIKPAAQCDPMPQTKQSSEPFARSSGT